MVEYVPDYIPHDQKESILGRGTEVLSIHSGQDVRVSVQELHKLLKTPEAAFKTPATQ